MAEILVIFAKIMKKFLSTITLLLCIGVFSYAQYDKDVFLFRGRTALQDGKYAQAIENFNVLAKLDSSDYWNFFFRGIAKYNLGDLRGAEKDFNASVRINPVFTNGYHYRAITESRQGEYDNALKDLQKAIDLRPGFVGLYYSRGVTYFLAQRFEEAVEDFNRYIRKEPKDASAYLNRGASYLFLKDTTKALQDYNTAIRTDRFEPEGYIRRGRLYAAMERYPEAIKDMDRAIGLDGDNTFAFFNRALMFYESKDYNAAMNDLNRVLQDEPGNALTLYNRSLILAQVGDFEKALDDMDRVININPRNVLAYFNRASYFIQLERWEDALADYNKAIELYPDFAKAYLNRSFVESRLGLLKASKADYDTAQQKVREYRSKDASAFADTTKKYNSLIALDAEFAKKDFDNELLQHRDIDIKLRPLYKFMGAQHREARNMALSRRYENALLDKFTDELTIPVVVSNSDTLGFTGDMHLTDASLSPSEVLFLMGMDEVQKKQYSSALRYFDQAVKSAGDGGDRNRYSSLYKAFYLMNRGVLKAEMIDFIASIESNVQTLTMDDEGATRARVSDRTDRTYDYSEAIADIEEAIDILPEIPYLYFNLGNLHCLSSQLVNAIEDYSRAIRRYPDMGDAYFNRGLVLIFLKDSEKGCIDLSRAGELGIKDAYSVINKYCKSETD